MPAPPRETPAAGGKPADPSPSRGADPSEPPAASTKEPSAVQSLLTGLPLTPALRWHEVSRGGVQGAAVVTSVEAHATRAGVAILEAGGNAIDAAVATALALAVTHPSAGNLGGGGFALLRRGDQIEAIDFREDAPRGLSLAAFSRMISRGGRGAVSVGVPGTVAGLHLLHGRHGQLSWQQVVEPSIGLAREGFALGARQAQTIHWARAGLAEDPGARASFLATQSGAQAGARLRQPKLAAALERIARLGPSGFYEGPTAEDIVDTLRRRLAAQIPPPDPAEQAALLTLDDLRRYRAEVRAPLSVDYHGARLVTMPPPSAGGATLLLELSMLDALGAEKEPPASAARTHLVLEASRRAQVERRLLLAAPERQPEPMAVLQRRWTDPDTWLAAHPVDRTQATRSATLHPLYAQSLAELEHTTHLSVVDQQGNGVSLTVTLSGSFGAHIATDETGIVLNNSVASFGSVGKNVPQGGVRTLSSMAPSLLLLSPKDFVVLGSPGGDTIPSTLTQLVLALIDDGRSLRDAVEAPRVHQGFVPDEVSMERLRPLAPSLQTALTKMGHRVRASRSTIGDANVAASLEGQAVAVYDSREGGLAAAATPPSADPASQPAPPNSP